MLLPFGFRLEADFQGSLLPFLGLLVGAAILIILTNRFKNKSETIWHGLLLFLRMAAVVLVLLLIFDPQISLDRTQSHPKRIAVVIDQSRSMTGTWQGSVAELHQSISRIIDQLKNTYDVDIWSMDGEALESVPVGFNKEMSLFSWSPTLDQTSKGERIYSAAFIISDGQLNRGRSPLDLPWSLTLPIYPILPLTPRDNSALKVIKLDYKHDEHSNDITHLKVKIQQAGFVGKIAALVVRNESGQLIGDQSINLNSLFLETSIPLHLSQTKSHDVLVTLSLQNGASKSEKHLNIAEAKSLKRVLLVSESVNELHKFLKLEFPDSLYKTYSVLGTKIKSGTSALPTLPSGPLDLIVVNQAGKQFIDEKTSRLIKKEMEENCPVILFHDGSIPVATRWKDLLGIRQQRTNSSPGDQSVYWKKAAKDHPFFLGLKGIGHTSVEMIKYPPINPGEYNISHPGAELLGLGVLSEQLPALLISDHPPLAVFNGGNYWRWFFHPQSKISFQKVWDYLLTYLEDIADFEPVSLDLPISSAATGETVGINIAVKDLGKRTIPTAELRVWQEDEAGKQIFLDLTRKLDGTYSSNLITRNPGKIKVVAEAYRFGELWGRDTSRIQLLVFSEEDQTTGVNAVLLARIAKRSGGQIIQANEDKLPIIPTSYYTQKSSFQLKGIRSPGLFVMLLTFLILEWVLRRRSGLL